MRESDDNATRTRNIFVRNYSSGVVKIFEEPKRASAEESERPRERESKKLRPEENDLREACFFKQSPGDSLRAR